MITGLVTSALVLLGAALTLVAAIGVVRMPDLFTRMSAASKASTLGVGLILVAVAVYARESGVVARAIAALLFMFVTIPVGAHFIARAAHIAGVPLWSGTVDDALARAREEREDTE